MLPSPNTLDLTDAAEVALFADLLSVSVEAIHAAAVRVGPMKPSLKFFVERAAKEAARGAKGASTRTARTASAVVVAPTAAPDLARLFADPTPLARRAA